MRTTMKLGAALSAPPWPWRAAGPTAARTRRGAGGFAVPDLKPLDELGDPEGEVSVLAWPGYVEDGSNDPEVDWISDFEKESGCKVTSRPSAPPTRPCS